MIPINQLDADMLELRELRERTKRQEQTILELQATQRAAAKTLSAVLTLLAWEPVETDRADILGARTLADGSKRYLMHNEAMNPPYQEWDGEVSR
jgi:hypothetical protein